MYILYTDETARQQAAHAPFFIYGGIFLPSQQVAPLHDAVEQIRRRRGFQPGDSLKFSTRDRPAHVGTGGFREAKREVIRACVDLGVRFTACVVLHELARNRTPAQLVMWGANSVIGAFHRFLTHEGETGMCVLDRLPVDHPDHFLREKFQVGLTFPGGRNRRLERIHGFSSSCDGASHLASAMDVVLGAFRYCVNERERDRAPRQMLPPLIRMMWHQREGDTVYIRERGLLLRPRTVQSELHRAEYDALVTRLIGLIDEG